MSSYELLELFGATIVDDEKNKVRTIRLDFAPEDGAVASALRGGERPEWKQMLAQSANELAVLRVAQVPDADADEYGERLFLPIARQRELEDEQMAIEAEQRDSTDNPEPGGFYSMWQEVS